MWANVGISAPSGWHRYEGNGKEFSKWALREDINHIEMEGLKGQGFSERKLIPL
jgi:hypothetical protein